ncbi:hypothetical protein AAG906_005337 [Vitis piasezkii]
MESAKCKICFRQFSNRKALGGHMRSHMAKLSIQPKPQKPDNSSKFSVHDDQESETDTPKNQSRRRSKRACRSINKKADSPDSSVVSDVDDFSAEDAAQLLVLLSREKWTRGKEVDNEELMKEDNFTIIYRCETCNKGFQSYQALGGHRASHKKLKIESDEEDIAPSKGNQRTFKCPFCFKVFESGQAMGGHKKVHMSTAAAAARRVSMPGQNFIDLNLPAPEEDNGSQVDDPSIK